MSKLKFIPDMFCFGIGKTDLSEYGRAAIVLYAQEAFDKWLSEQPMVYRSSRTDPEHWFSLGSSSDTHIARLVDIQPVYKSVCKHKHFKNIRFHVGDGMRVECECGALLKPQAWATVND